MPNVDQIWIIDPSVDHLEVLIDIYINESNGLEFWSVIGPHWSVMCESESELGSLYEYSLKFSSLICPVNWKAPSYQTIRPSIAIPMSKP